MTSPEQPTSVRPVEYKGEPLDAERGPGLGCFRFQLVVLLALVVLTPLSVAWDWDPAVSAGLLILTLLILLFAGQTVIFLLRLVAADRRDGRRRPLASETPTVGELEDEPEPETDDAAASTPPGLGAPTADASAAPDGPGSRDAGMRE